MPIRTKPYTVNLTYPLTQPRLSPTARQLPNLPLPNKKSRPNPDGLYRNVVLTYQKRTPFGGRSSETVSFFRPLRRREANTRRPLAVAILERKPCLFLRLRVEG